MGIPQLFDIIKARDAEQIISIAQLAESHYKQHGRPLRIAVDEADFRFNNLTQAQVYAIRETSNEPAFQGIEKSMFYRICRFLTLNVHLVFVFDGPHRPWKRNKQGGGKIDYEKRKLLKEVLTCLGVPYHEAPGEAEAECARLQILGLVDAVWSQDSDCLMFGCTLWLRDDRVAKEKGSKDRSKENTKKNNKTTRVVRASDFGLSREELVLFVMLVGGDYDTVGLAQCGPALAMRAAQGRGLARDLCLCQSQRDCDDWRIRLIEFIQSAPHARGIHVPPTFPSFKTMQKYYRPIVTSDEHLRNNAKLSREQIRPIDEHRLLNVTSSRFNIWGKTYMNWIGPILLTRCLSGRDSSLAREVVHGIKVIKRQAKQSPEQPQSHTFERKITFSPFELTSLRKEDFEGDRAGMWAGVMDKPFDSTHRVECDYMPEYWLRQVLPPDIVDPPPPEAHIALKRKPPMVDEQDTATGTPRPVKRSRKPQDSAKKQGSSALHPSSNNNLEIAHHHIPPRTSFKTRSRNPSTSTPRDIIELSDSDDEDRALRPPPKVRSQAPLSVRSAVSHIVKLSSPESSDDDNDQEEEFGSATQEARALPDTPGHPRPLQGFSLFDEIEGHADAELQLAIRLSLQGQQPTTRHSGKTPGRNGRSPPWGFLEDELQSLFVPEKSSSHKGTHIPTTPVASRQQIRKAVAQDLDNFSKHDDVHGIRPKPSGTSGWSFSPTAATAGIKPNEPLKTPKTTSHATPSIGTTSVATPKPSPNAAQIRAARRRHFESKSAIPPTAKTPKPQPLPKTSPSRVVPRISGTPLDVDYIDLTGD